MSIEWWLDGPRYFLLNCSIVARKPHTVACKPTQTVSLHANRRRTPINRVRSKAILYTRAPIITYTRRKCDRDGGARVFSRVPVVVVAVVSDRAGGNSGNEDGRVIKQIKRLAVNHRGGREEDVRATGWRTDGRVDSDRDHCDGIVDGCGGGGGGGGGSVRGGGGLLKRTGDNRDVFVRGSGSGGAAVVGKWGGRGWNSNYTP